MDKPIIKRMIFIWLPMLSFLLAGCQSQEMNYVNYYYSAVWSPDGQRTAYFRRHLEYQTTQKIGIPFIGEESQKRILTADVLFLCLNSADGKNEQVASKLTYPLYQPDPYVIPDIFTSLVWEEDTILFGGGAAGWFNSGVHSLNLGTREDLQIEKGYDQVIQLGRQTQRKVFNNLQLYSSEDRGYGQINNQAIFLFDHRQRQVSIYVSDPFLKEPPRVPTYSITKR